MGRLRGAGSPETTRITNTANWYKGRLDGEDLFVIYSSVYTNNPTILYERKGVNGRAELDILLNQLEEIENGRSIVEVSKDINTLLGGDWLQEKHNLANNNAGLGGGGSNTGYASVLQRKSSKFIGSQAFRNVVKNLFDIQERDRRLNESASSSLKGQTDLMSEYKKLRDTIEDVRDGKKNSTSKLYKYVEDGTISTKDYNELIEKYGAIPSGERPHREVYVPRKTAKDKKVSQTIRTIHEAKETPETHPDNVLKRAQFSRIYSCKKSNEII